MLAVTVCSIASAPACGRLGYDAVDVVADAGAGAETAAGDLAPGSDGPGAGTDGDALGLDRPGSPFEVAADVAADLPADVPPELGPDQPRPDVGPVVPARCTEPGGRIDPASGHCYFPLSPGAGIWADARTGCEGQGAHLATITSAAEQAFALSLLGTEELWLGLYQIGTGSWQWVTGEAVAFLAWAPLEPDEPSDGRGRLTANGWHGTEARRRYLALCERDP